jgi:hypothetical protein
VVVVLLTVVKVMLPVTDGDRVDRSIPTTAASNGHPLVFHPVPLLVVDGSSLTSDPSELSDRTGTSVIKYNPKNKCHCI